MKRKALILLSVFGLFTILSCEEQRSSEVSLTDHTDSLSYSFGINMAMKLKNMKEQGLDTLNVKVLVRAIEDIYYGEPLFKDFMAQNIIQSHFEAFKRIKKAEENKKSEKNIEIGKNFLAENKTKEGVIELPGGVQYIVLKEGAGASPQITDIVTVHYHGTLIDGTVFDSSTERGEPAKFPVNRVIPGWTQVLQLMKPGDKWKVFIPENLAYGANPRQGGTIEPYSTLIFEVELISVEVQEQND